MSINPVHIKETVKYLHENGWVRKTVLAKFLHVSGRHATRIIAYLRDDLGLIEKSGNGYRLVGEIGTKSGQSGHDEEKRIYRPLPVGKSADGSRDQRDEDGWVETAQPAAQPADEQVVTVQTVHQHVDGDPLRGRPISIWESIWEKEAADLYAHGLQQLQTEAADMQAYRSQILRMVSICEVEDEMRVKHKHRIGLAYRDGKRSSARDGAQDTYIIRVLRDNLTIMSMPPVRVEWIRLQQVERLLDAEIPAWREHIKDPGYVDRMRYRWSTDPPRIDDYIPEPPADYQDITEQEAADPEAAWQRTMQEDVETHPAGVDTSPVAVSVVEDEPVTTPPPSEASLAVENQPVKLEAGPAAPQAAGTPLAALVAQEPSQEVDLRLLPLDERLLYLLGRKGSAMKKSEIVTSADEEEGRVVIMLSRLCALGKVEGIPPPDTYTFPRQWSYRLVEQPGEKTS
jgi:hypothetical protein